MVLTSTEVSSVHISQLHGTCVFYEVTRVWSPTALEVLEIVDKVVVAGNKLRGLFDWVAIGILLAKLALAKLLPNDPRMLEHVWPWFDIIELAPHWLLVDEIKIVGKLLLCHFSSKFSEWLVYSVVMMLPRVLMSDSVEARPATE